MSYSIAKISLAASAVAVGAMVAFSGVAQQAAPARPDFNGIWGGGVLNYTCATTKKDVNAFNNAGVERFGAGGAKGAQKWVTFEQDCGVQNRGRVNKPMYKPAEWDNVRKRDLLANVGGEFVEYSDPQWRNIPVGVPRLGAPNKIVQTANEIIFLYENQNQHRVIPTDCREHDPVMKYDQTVNGIAVGCWEGDSLVVTSMGFSDRTWLHWSGYHHSNEMVVIEKFTRQGDVLVYEPTVQDPVMFMQPWKMDVVRLSLNKTPGLQMMQDVPYDDRSLGALTDPYYRG